MASTIEVLLTDNVLKLGAMGDIVRVKAGFARNYLMPQGKAILASRAAKRQIEVLQQRALEADRESREAAQATKRELDGLSIQIAARVAHDRHLFGSVGIRDIVAKLADGGITIDPRQVHLHESFKELGRYEVLLKLHSDVEATIVVEIVNADPNAGDMDDVIAEIDADAAAGDES